MLLSRHTLPSWAAVASGRLAGGGLDASTLSEDTTATLANPERGFFTYSETYYQSDNSGHVALNASTLATARTTSGRTLVFREFYMPKWRTVDTISQAYLDLVAADLAAIRTAGCKAVIRFAYASSGTESPYGSDTTPARIVGHIGQLAEVLNDHADVIYAVQAGFIGTWGEWYYSDNFTTDTDEPWILSSDDWANRKLVLDALLTDIDERIFLQLRYAGIKDHWAGNLTAAQLARIGFHNDAFGAPFANYGTFTTFTALDEAATRAYVTTETTRAHPVPHGGESAVVNEPDTLWPASLTALAAQGFSYLNPEFHPDVLTSWSTNIAIAQRRLGYRLVGTEARSQDTIAAGALLRAEVDITNAGFAAPCYDRPVIAVLDDQAGNRIDYPLTVDVRDLTPGDHTVWADLPVPAGLPAGDYQLALWMPDHTAALRSRAEYSMRLTNSGTWDATRGYNALCTVTVE